jgi:DNA-binding NarL/FixJ family response regulator
MNRLGILIADEDQSVRRCLQKSIERHPQLEVLWQADNGLEALLTVRKERPHIVIMDARLPRMDGLEVTRCLRRDKNPVRILLMSAYEEHRGEAMSAGADAFVMKDSCRDTLNSAILRLAACSEFDAQPGDDPQLPEESRQIPE